MGFFKKLFGKNTDDFYAPMAGKAVPISQVPDPTFAEGMLGNGIAIEPSDRKSTRLNSSHSRRSRMPSSA